MCSSDLEAIDQLRQLLNIAPSHTDAARRLAELYLDRGKVDESVGALETAGLMEPDADLWFQIGDTYSKQNRADDAILAYRRALIAQPEHVPAQRALARMGASLEEPDDEET